MLAWVGVVLSPEVHMKGASVRPSVIFTLFPDQTHCLKLHCLVGHLDAVCVKFVCRAGVQAGDVVPLVCSH